MEGSVDERKTEKSQNESELIKCKTVSYRDSSLEDNAEFEKNYNLYKAKYKLPTN